MLLCVAAASRLRTGDIATSSPTLPQGIIMAVVIGILLGVVIGAVLLAVVFSCRRSDMCSHSTQYSHLAALISHRVLCISDARGHHKAESQTLSSKPPQPVPLIGAPSLLPHIPR